MAAARASVAAGLLGGAAYFLMFRESNTVQAQTSDAKKKAGLVRRHSSGDHAFLPNRTERNAKRISQTNYGVQKEHAQDTEGLQLPTVHEAKLR